MNKITIFVALLVAVTTFFTGCSSKGLNAGMSSEMYPAADTTGVEIKTRSLMQQMMDAAEREKIVAVFSPDSSDRAMGGYSDGNIFSIIANSSAANGDIIRTTSRPYAPREFKIKRPRPILDRLKESSPSFLAMKLYEDKAPLGTTRLSVDGSISSRVRAAAVKYDETSSAFGGKEKGLYDFAQYLSSSFAIAKEPLYFGYDPKNNVLFLDSGPIAIESTPYRIFLLKKRLDDEKIRYRLEKETGIIITSGFFDWEKAYTISEEMDPFSSQVYVVSTNGIMFSVNEGYSKDNLISIEFIGWNRDGSRDYMYYGADGARKISTSQRICRFNDKSGQTEIKFY